MERDQAPDLVDSLLDLAGLTEQIMAHMARWQGESPPEAPPPDQVFRDLVGPADLRVDVSPAARRSAAPSRATSRSSRRPHSRAPVASRAASPRRAAGWTGPRARARGRGIRGGAPGWGTRRARGC